MTVMRTYIYWYTYLGFKQSKEKVDASLEWL